MLKIGIVGLGFMGKMHFDNYQSLKGVKVVAIADLDPKKRKGDWSAIAGNIQGKGSKPDLSKITMYETPEELIADPEVDVVDITLPTNLHCKFVLKSLAAGKPTICEKPLARTSAEAEKMVKAAKKARLPLFVGQCIRFWPEYQAAKEIVDKGTYGKVLQAHFERFSLTPTWSWDNWLLDYKRSGGAALDLHIHDTDLVQYFFGKPTSISADKVGFSPETADHVRASYHFAKRKNLLVTTEGGWMYTPSFGFTMRFRIHMEKATMVFDLNGKPTFQVFPLKGRAPKPKLLKGDGYSQELKYFTDCIKRGLKPRTVTPESAALSVKMIETELASARKSGAPVKL